MAEADRAAPARRLVRAACPHDCPDTCAMLVTVEGEGAAARAIRVEGAPDHPFTQGTLCNKVSRYLERTYAPTRILHPMRRVGPKGPGRGRFERVPWDQALDTIAARFRDVAASDGPESILPYSYAGTMGLVQYGSMDRRFFHRLGASQLERTICATAGTWGQKATLGASIGSDPEHVVDAKLILIWGSNPIVSNLHFWTRVQEAKRRGAKVIAIDPYRSQTADKCHEHVAPLPGTDGALALGMMHVIIGEGLVDRDYVARHTLGYEALAKRVLEWTPERAAATCGIDAGTVVRLAREYATASPSAIRLNYGMQRHAGGGMAVRTITCLPALTGAWRHPAGGLLMSTGGAAPADLRALEMPELMPDPAPRMVNMSAIGDALLDLRDPPVRAVCVYNSNPVAVAPDSRKVVAGFSRADLFTVVMDVFATDTADYADILLPATTQLEHFDVHKAYGHYYVLANLPAIPPQGEALPNSEVFRRLAARMGFDDPWFRDSDEDLCRQALKWDHPMLAGTTWDDLKAEGWRRLSVPADWAPYAEGGYRTPSGKCEFESAWLAGLGFDPLPTYIPPRENRDSNPVLAGRYPLAMISPPARNGLNSSFANLPAFLDAEQRPTVDLHPEDAADRGIAHGDAVRVFNDRGSFQARARVTDAARPGVAVAVSLWWKKLSGDGANANDVTSQAVADFGNAATFYDCLVEVVKA